MAGVVQMIDLLITEISKNKAIKDAGVTGAQIGHEIGQALQQTPAVKSAAANLGAAISSELEKATGRAKMDMAALAESSSRVVVTAVNPMTAAMSKAALETQNLGTASVTTSKGLNTVRSGLLQIAGQATGMRGPLASVVNGLLTFAGGGTVVLAIAAGLAVIAKGWELITQKSQEARDATKKFFDQLDSDIKARARREDPATAFFGDFEKIREEFEKTQRLLATARQGSTVTTEAGGILHIVDEKEVTRLEGELAKLRDRAIEVGKQLNEALAAKVGPVHRERIAAVSKVLDLEKEVAKIEAESRKLANDWWKDERERIDKEEDAEAKHQQDLADKRASLSDELKHQLVKLTASTVDDLELQLHDLQVKIIETFGAVPAEYQPLLDDLREKIKKAKEDTSGLKDPVKGLGTDWKKIGDTIAGVSQGLLDMARGLGLVSEKTDKVLQGFIGIGRNLAGALKLDPASLLGFAGGVVSVVGGLFGHPNKDPDRFAQNQAWFEAASSGDANALEQLRIHSVVSTAGGTGWGSAAAAADAKAKYDAALKATAPGRAAAAADAAAQAEQDRLDQIRQGEERQVSARTEAERRANIQTLLASGGPQDLTDKLQKLEQEFERLVAASPLGEDSPLARDAKQRADDAAQELDRAVQDAKKAAGDQITPGFTVQRTITESSAGRVVGELITSNVWLEKIYGALSGVGPGASTGGVSGGFGDIHVYVGGEEVTAIVSRGQAKEVQNRQALNGNASLPS